MEAMNLVEAVLDQGNDEEHDRGALLTPIGQSSPIKGLDESVTITVTRTPGKPVSVSRQSGKPANYIMMSSSVRTGMPPSPIRNGRNSDAMRMTARDEMVCGACDRVFKYKAAFVRHEAQCGLPVALKMERAAILESKRAEKVAELERQKLEEKKEEKLPELRCPTCLKQFSDNDAFKKHDFQACAEERATYVFICSVCKARFKYKNHLNRHEDSHNNVRRYSCDVCSTAFLRPDHLKRHMIRMHGIVQLPTQNAPVKPKAVPRPIPSSDVKKNVSTTKNVPMQCPMCSKVLSRRDHLLRHMRNVHHVNYESRRGRSADTVQGLEDHADSAGLAEQAQKDFYRDEEDGSENLSMTSHDGLLIDESYESVKTECESPTPDDDDEAESVGTSEKNMFSEPHQLKASVKPGNNSYMQCSEIVSVKSDVTATNGSDANSLLNHPHSSGKESIASPLNNGLAFTRTGPWTKAGNSDGNQNVLSNGHAARSSPSVDWISDLQNYNGW